MTIKSRKTSVPTLQQRQKKQGILLLGMHRSGTSAITRVLNLLGCALPSEILGPNDGNELGHWEAAAAVALNDEILASAGSSWDDWGAINDDWQVSGLRAEMLGRIGELVSESSTLGPLFILKDPRLCKVADLWIEGMELVGVEPLTIVMLRNPAEVIKSLENRDLMSPAYGQLLWLRHVLDAEYFSRGRRRVFCRYDQLMSNWQATIDQIKAELGIVLPRNSPVAHAEVERYLSDDQRHHDLHIETSLSGAGYSAWLRRTFAILLDWSNRGENQSHFDELDKIRHEFDCAYSAFASLLVNSEAAGNAGSGSRLKRELVEQIASAQRASEEAESSIQEAAGRLAVAAQLEANLMNQVEEGNTRALELNTEIERLRSEADRLGKLVVELEADLATQVDEGNTRTLELNAEIEELRAEADRLRRQEVEMAHKMSVIQLAIEAAQAESKAAGDQCSVTEQKLSAVMADLDNQVTQNAELTGRLTSVDSALVQRQEELSQLWDRLLCSEKAASAAEVQATQERERRLEAEQRHNSAEARNVKLQVRLEDAEAALSAIQQNLSAQSDEIANLTRLLQEQEATAQLLETARSAAEKGQVKYMEECGQLRAELQQKESMARDAEATLAATQQKLSTRFDEIAQLTAILADESNRSAIFSADASWLREINRLSEGFPKWWNVMPRHWHRKRVNARYRQAGLFDAEVYLETYPDVAQHGMDPLRHYILHGMSEGRIRPQ